ncbi:MAG: HAMP domain-containing protein [Methanomicrobiales archaeon]|nr:HAMP domain-containing protein [Methanomicrobiales archaeon]
MDLRRKTLIIYGVSLLCILVTFWAITQLIVLGSYVALEEQTTSQNMDRFLNALHEDQNEMETLVRALAPRDDTYTFMRDRNPKYLETNFGNETLLNRRISYVVFANTTGQIFSARAFDLQRREEVALPGAVADMVTGNAALRTFNQTNSSVTGIVLLPGGPVMVASAPVTTGDFKSVVRGTLIVGRALDDAEIQRIARLTSLRLQLLPSESSQVPPEVRSTFTEGEGKEGVVIQPLPENTIAGYKVLRDLYGAPALVVRTDMPRTIYSQGVATLQFFVLCFVALVIVFGIVFFYFLERSVLSPLSRLSQDVAEIGMTRNLAARLPPGEGDDELTHLAENINSTLAALERAQLQIQRSEEKNRALVNAMPDTMFQINHPGISEGFTSAEAAEMAEKAIGEVAGRQLEDIGETYELVSPAPSPDELPVLAPGETILRPFIFEFRATIAGAIRYFEVRIVRSGEGEALAIVREITDRKKAEAELEEYRSHLEDLVSARTAELSRTNEQLRQEILARRLYEEQKRKAFEQIEKNIEQFAILGDHIRNPLTVIVGLSDLIQDSTAKKILEQAKIIDGIITRLDQGWIESEKVREFLKKYYSDERKGL